MDNSEPKMTIVCISDTHNKAHQLQLPKGDVLVHGGDFTLTGLPEEVAKFNDFLKQASYEAKVVIAGNHDLSFDLAHYSSDFAQRFHSHIQPPIDPVKTKALLKDCIYLEDSSVNIKGYSFYGSPYSPTFFDWGFNLNIGKPLEAKWAQIPTETDILITHSPPFQILDKTQDGVEAGCPNLREVIFKRVKPLLHVFGHIHEAYGKVNIDGTCFVNASSLNYNYKSGQQPPITFEVPLNREKK